MRYPTPPCAPKSSLALSCRSRRARDGTSTLMALLLEFDSSHEILLMNPSRSPFSTCGSRTDRSKGQEGEDQRQPCQPPSHHACVCVSDGIKG